MIDLHRLSAFVAIAEEGHVTRAAERLGMLQPQLSRLLRGLEEELGTRLVHRLPRGVRPTEAGQVLLDEARLLLARARDVPERVARAARGELGNLAVGFTASAALHPFVATVLRAFRESYPGVAVALEEASTAELVDAMLHERIDAAFVRSSAGIAPGLVAEPVLEEPMVAALPAGHPQAVEADAPLPLTALSGDAFILYRRRAGPGLYDSIVAACRAAGFSPRVAQEAPRLPATLSLVAAGLGVTLVPASMRRLGVDAVVYRPLAEGTGLSAPLLLATRRDGTAAVARLRALVKRMTP